MYLYLSAYLFNGIVLGNKYIKVFYMFLGLLIYRNFLFKNIKISKDILKILALLSFSYLLPWGISLLINGTVQNRYLIDIVHNTSFIIYIYILILLNKKYTIDIIINSVINIILFQNLLGILLYPYKNFMLMLNNFFTQNILYLEKLEMELSQRIVGVGTSFFGMGVDNAVGLVFLSYMILKYPYKKKNYIKYLLILLVGMIASRTTLVGLICSLIFFVLNFSLKKIVLVLKNLMLILVVLSFILGGVLFFYYDKISHLLSFGFELFINYFKTGSLEANSTIHLQKMYFLPQTLKTFLFGDGIFVTEFGYYMKTDVGYLRDLFYTGILGVMCIIYFKIVLFFKVKNNTYDKKIIMLSLTLFLLDMFVNLKGWININKYQYLLITYLLVNKKQRDIENESGVNK